MREYIFQITHFSAPFSVFFVSELTAEESSNCVWQPSRTRRTGSGQFLLERTAIILGGAL